MTPSTQEIENWIRARVSMLMDLPADQIDTDESLVRQGLDSVGLVALTSDLEIWLGYRFRKNPLEEYPSIQALAGFLAEQSAVEKQP